MGLSALQIVPVKRSEEARFKELMDRHHYLGGAAEDRRKCVLCGGCGRPMGCAFVVLRLRSEK